MFKKIRNLFRVIDIDLWIYVMNTTNLNDFPKLNFTVESEVVSTTKKRFFIKVGTTIIHESFLYERLFVLRILRKNGPAIGDCRTIDSYKGQSIYPFVIHHIAYEEIQKNQRKEVFIAVHPSNISSIKGIEKAGFQRYAQIKAKRLLFFHFQVKTVKN